LQSNKAFSSISSHVPVIVCPAFIWATMWPSMLSVPQGNAVSAMT
jgi:hypothetical protein